MNDKNAVNESIQGISAPDGVIAAPDHHEVVFENERVRVLDTRIKPGEKVPVHAHNLSSVVCFLSGGDFVRYDADGEIELDTRTSSLEMKPGAVRWMPPQPPHSLENVGDTEIRGITVELKD